MNRPDSLAPLQAAVTKAKAEAKDRYESVVVDAKAAYQAELVRIDQVRDAALAAILGGGEGVQSTPPSVAARRKVTWREAVLTALEKGPEDGVDVEDILSVVGAMGVKEKSLTRDPLAMVDATLYALGDQVTRVGRKKWALANYTPKSSLETQS